MEWRFKELTRNDTLQNASHLEFFHNEALQSAVDALAREDIQNRLDARAPNEPRVEVRYRLCGPVTSGRHTEWLKGLAPHLDAPQVTEELGAHPSIERPLQWLVIEDFATTGLEGDPECFQDPLGGVRQRNDFFWFIRNVGRSGKKGADRGRWGLGKIVYPAASQIRSFFAYSVRRSDHQRSLVGRSVLAVHNVGREQHDSEGYFGRFDDPNHAYFATPELDSRTLDRFASDFDVARRADEPGLSLVIPWPEENITLDALIRSLVEHWFWVLLDDRLVVRVILPATGEESLLSAATVEDVIRQRVGETTLEGQQLLRKLQFAREVIIFEPKNVVQLSPCPSGSAPKWDHAEERFGSTEIVDDLRTRYHHGELLGFDVPVRVRRKDGMIDEQSSFEVYVQRTDTGAQTVETFLRDGLTISGQHYLREPGVLALVKAGDTSNDALGTLLGDAENPAHTRWERGGKHFRGRYDFGPSILTYVQRAALNLSSVLSRRPEGLDKDLLQHLFSVPEPGHATAIGPKPKAGPVIPPVVPPIKPPTYFLQCTKVQGGFHIQPHPKAERPPAAIQLRAAYEVVRGNPFRLHHPADFDFTKKSSGLDLEFDGLTVSNVIPNRLILTVDRPDFQLTATGFDPHRDLILDIRPLHDDTADNDDSIGVQGSESEND
jgi:hypothetical protein